MAPSILIEAQTGSTPVQSVKAPMRNSQVLVENELTAKFAEYRQLVPLLAKHNITYLNAALTPPSNTIIRSALDKFNDDGLNLARPKQAWQARTEEVRDLVGRYINAKPETIAFTRDTTEGLGYFIRSIEFEPGDNVVMLDTEHPNHAYGWLSMRSAGLEVRQVKTGKECYADASTFAPYVDNRTKAVGISAVMFHSGQKNNVRDICNVFRPQGIHILVDATQQVGFAPFDVQDLGISAASFSLHKGLNCPTGLACLYIDPITLRSLKPVPPVVGYGGVSNVRADLIAPSDHIIYHPTTRRYEHLNISFIAAAAAHASLTFYLDTMGVENVEKYLYLLGDALRAGCEELGIAIVGPSTRDRHSPHLYVLGLLHPAWQEHLENNAVIVQHYRMGIRVSFSFYNNLSDIKRFAEVLKLGLDAGIPAQ